MDAWSKRFLKLLDEDLEEEATRPRGTVSLAALGIWRRTSRLYHLRGNLAVRAAFARLIDQAGIAWQPAADEIRKILFGDGKDG